MKKRTLTGIIILMSISLAGIIIVQLFWLKNAIEIKEKQFDRSVNDALVDAVNLLQKKANIDWVADKVWDTRSQKNGKTVFYKDSISGNKVVVKSGSNSYVYVNGKPDEDIEQTITITSGEPGTWVADKMNDKEFRLKSIEMLDSIKSGLEKHQYTILTELTDSIDVVLGKKISQITKQSKSMNEALNELVYEIKSYNEPPAGFSDPDEISQALKSTLQDKEIDLPFEFAVYNPVIDSLTTVKSAGFQPEAYKQYKTRLFPESYFGKPELLLLEFTGRKMHLLRSLGFLLAGSLLFTLIILITFYVTIRVIIQQKKMSEIKSDFINNMTHEFKTPIATISLAVDSINSPKVIGSPEKIKYFTGIIGEENKRMNDRVENVLQMALVEKKEFNLNPENADFHELAKDVLKNFALQLDKKKGQIDFHFDARNPMVFIDRMHFANVISNLADNAIKYSDHPEITLSTKNTDNGLTFVIKDNGIGMTRDEQEKVFDQFYRVSRGNIHNVKGFGLGLSYVKVIVEASGGKIRINSSPGKGSSFIIELPQEII